MDPVKAPVAGRLAALILIFTAALVTIGWAYSIVRSRAPDDDSAYLFYCSASLSREASIDRLGRKAIDRMKSDDRPVEQIQRQEFRHNYRRNYLLHTAAIAAWSHRIPPPESAGLLDYWKYFAVPLRLGLLTGHLVILAIVLAVAVTARRRTLVFGFALTASILFAAQFLTPGSAADWRPTLESSPGWFFRKFISFLVNPGIGLDPFGSTARNGFTFFLLGIFIARWSDRITLCYLLVLFSSLIHQTYAGLVLAMLLPIDCLVRPEIVLSRRVMPVWATTAVVFGIREDIWNAFGGSHIVVPIAVLAAITLAIYRLPAVQRRISNLVLVRRFRSLRPEASDFLFFCAGAVLLIGITRVLAAHASEVEAKYVWGELAGRGLALMRMPIAFAIGIASFEGLARQLPKATPLLLLACCGFLATIGAFRFAAAPEAWVLDGMPTRGLEQRQARIMAYDERLEALLFSGIAWHTDPAVSSRTKVSDSRLIDSLFTLAESEAHSPVEGTRSAMNTAAVR